MAIPIKYLLLQKSELMYEVAIRGESPSDNVAGLRRQVTKLTQLYSSDDIIDSVFQFLEDSKGSQETLEKVKANLDALQVSFDEPLYNRTKALLHHLYYRLQRIEEPQAADDLAKLSKLKKKYEGYYEILLSLDKPQIKEQLHSATSVTTEDFIDKPNLSGMNIAVSCDRGILGELNRIKYDGKTCVRSFIQKVEEFRTSKNISENKILSSATDIFVGDALHWYRNIRGIVNSWSEVLTYLKDDFDVPDYDYRMASEIRQRTQGEEESITIYLSIMQGMFSRLSKPLEEDVKLEIILHNIRPCYSTIIAASPNIKSLEDLKIICKNYERIKVRSELFKEPPSVSANTLAPEFGYQSSKRKSTNNHQSNFYGRGKNEGAHSQELHKVSEIQASEVEVSAVSKAPYCHRCRVNTHSMKDCTAERKIFCFKCGMKEVRTPECPNCKQKN
ncbi:hypothetical protein PYW08_003422 [Mythimna loreyi]|uniref:Uncharacterized protein n=1 Tax=Mythimna loreyi TaxID=667449 RepID=A0ACC2QRQ3_9NEOP|nr:hypothetical protein PYW08_003422 [Mythimna loreyi]